MVAIALILAAVFIPTVFIPGITGRLYQQFAVTIAISVIFSAFNALSLSPALAALLLKPRNESARACWRVLRPVQSRFRPRTDGYVRTVGRADSQSVFQPCAAGGHRRRRGLHRRQAARPRSCRKKTRATSSSACSCPMPLRSQRTDAAAQKVEDIILRTRPACKVCTSVDRLQPAEQVQTTYNAFFFVT